MRPPTMVRIGCTGTPTCSPMAGAGTRRSHATLRRREVVHILHRGIMGGWTIEDETGLLPKNLCGLFVFCRYLERENEFMTV